MLARGELGLEADVVSDTRPLWPAVDALLDAAGPELRTIRDATRGGVATVLNELARASAVGITVDEAAIPVAPEVGGRRRTAWNRPDVRRQRGRDGRLRRPRGERTQRSPRCAAVPGCEAATEIAEVRAEPPGMVLVDTAFGGRRVMDLLAGDPLPRIC